MALSRKKDRKPSALPPGSYIATSSGVHAVRENLPRRFNFVYLGMLPKEKEG